jgi:hypothetical protein
MFGLLRVFLAHRTPIVPNLCTRWVFSMKTKYPGGFVVVSMLAVTVTYFVATALLDVLR